ncbi:MAG: hypothetical protein LV481_09400 [Methylacidiphilales bacterium]|nr:hypothetical protein [Candidatus Methylacidiphilales bacterium]
MDTYGVIKIIDPKVFFTDPSVDSLVDEFNELIGTPRLPTTTRDWPRVTRSFKSESFFILSVCSPALEGSIKFDSAGSTEGRYDLKITSQSLNESGTIVKVKPIPEDHAAQYPFTGLQVYPDRFYVETSATNDRQGTKRVWLIGISSYKNAEVADPSTSSG